MPLMRWHEPFSGLARMREEMNRMFEDFFGGRPGLAPRKEGARIPAIDVSQTETEVVLKAELPGVEKKDLDVQVLPDSISIKGESKQEEEVKDENFYRRERSYAAFAGTIPLPVEVKAEEAKAKHQDGLLTVTIPKVETAETEKAKKVEVE